MSVVRFATASLCGIFLTSTLVRAEEPGWCSPDAGTIVAELEKRGQHITGLGFNAQGTLVRLLEDPADGSWSIVISLPPGPGSAGAGCLVDSGIGWVRPGIPL